VTVTSSDWIGFSSCSNNVDSVVPLVILYEPACRFGTEGGLSFKYIFK